MYLQEDDYKKWIDHINENVEDPEKGGFICGEIVGDGPEINFGGAYSEVIKILAALVYYVGYQEGKTLENTLPDIEEAWNVMKNSGMSGKAGDVILDLDTGIGFNPVDETIHFRPIPEEIQKEMIERMEGPTNACKKMVDLLSTKSGISTVINACLFSGNFTIDSNDKEDGLIVRINYEGHNFVYDMDDPGFLTFMDDGVCVTDFFEHDSEFRKKINEMCKGRFTAV